MGLPAARQKPKTENDSWFFVVRRFERTFSQGLKPAIIFGTFGTTEVVP
jgi:hypothetical protein